MTFIPSVFMFGMSIWALFNTLTSYILKDGSFVMPVGTNNIVPILCVIYIVLAVWVAIECSPAIIKHALNRKNSQTVEA